MMKKELKQEIDRLMSLYKKADRRILLIAKELKKAGKDQEAENAENFLTDFTLTNTEYKTLRNLSLGSTITKTKKEVIERAITDAETVFSILWDKEKSLLETLA